MVMVQTKPIRHTYFLMMENTQLHFLPTTQFRIVLTIKKNDFDPDNHYPDLHDGFGCLGGGPHLLDECRVVTDFIFTVTRHLGDYQHKMSEARVLNAETSKKFEKLAFFKRKMFLIFF